MSVTEVRSAHPHGHVTSLAVAGPLLGTDHGAELVAVAATVPASDGLVIDLSQVTVINDQGLELLRRLAERAVANGQRLAFVCTELILRSELVLADLDTLAPVLDREEHATHFLRAAA
jgi:anti-anti-sigma regulatory factor